MLQFILTNILLISLGVILFMMAKSLPRLEEAEGEKKQSILEKWITSEIPHKIDAFINTFTGKFFRKMKVFLLRVDNNLTTRLKKMNHEQNGKPKIDFADITGEKEEEKKEEEESGQIG